MQVKMSDLVLLYKAVAKNESLTQPQMWQLVYRYNANRWPAEMTLRKLLDKMMYQMEEERGLDETATALEVLELVYGGY